MVYSFTTLRKNPPYKKLKIYSEDAFWQVNLDLLIIRTLYAFDKGFWIFLKSYCQSWMYIYSLLDTLSINMGEY